MARPASVKKHRLHPMLVAFPIGVWVFALACGIAAGTGATAQWRTVAPYCVAGGIVGAVIAAEPGLIEYFFINEAAMKKIATFHLVVNVAAVIAFAVNLWSLHCHRPVSYHSFSPQSE
jgi:uncharacterized membrane protein